MVNGVKVDLTELTRKISDLKAVKHNAMPEFLALFKKLTPDSQVTGESSARQHTTLVADKIVADYDYAEVLDLGRHMSNRGMRGSEQAPHGMSKPTIEYMKKTLPKKIQKIGLK